MALWGFGAKSGSGVDWMEWFWFCQKNDSIYYISSWKLGRAMADFLKRMTNTQSITHYSIVYLKLKIRQGRGQMSAINLQSERKSTSLPIPNNRWLPISNSLILFEGNITTLENIQCKVWLFLPKYSINLGAGKIYRPCWEHVVFIWSRIFGRRTVFTIHMYWILYPM